MLWLVALFVVPFYGVLAVAFGDVDPIFGNAVPVWNPLRVELHSFGDILERVVSAELGAVFVRTVVYVGSALAICFLIGFPVAYYVARFAGRRRGLLLALLLAPFWISYLMRMLAWVNLLQTDGYVNDITAAVGLGRVSWLDGRAFTVILGLVYGYVPFLVLPLFAALDRIDPRVLEASRDLGMGPAATFLRVTLPHVAPGHARRRRDHRAADDRRLLHRRPAVGLAAHEHDRQPDRVLPVPRLAEGGRRLAGDHPLGAARSWRCTATCARSTGRAHGSERRRSTATSSSGDRVLARWWEDPWRRPVFLATATWLYIAVVDRAGADRHPVLVQLRTLAQRVAGLLVPLVVGRPTRSLVHDPSLRQAMTNSLVLAVLTMLIATPLGVALALGLSRWRGPVARGSNLLMLVPLSTPEIVMGTMLFLVFDNLFTFVPLGRTAMLLGHVTFSISYVVVIVRGRLLTIGRDLEEAAQDLGATPMQALRTVLLPLLGPAVFASLMIVFATSIDDFVISAFLSADASTETVPIKIYSTVRGSPTPALNAMATAMLLGTAIALVLAVVALRVFRRGERGSAVEDFARIEI